MILCDTSVLLCLVDRSQPYHRHYKRTVLTLRRPLITTWPCLTEAMHLALRRGGWPMQRQLGEFLLDGWLTAYTIQPNLIPRILELMEQYCDRPMDFADASLVLVAEQMGYRQILTLDSDFFVYRINGKDSFEVLPQKD